MEKGKSPPSRFSSILEFTADKMYSIFPSLSPPDPREAYSFYTPNYCEENVYHFLRSPQFPLHGVKLFAVFISNPTRNVAFHHQRAMPFNQVCCWDYHVIAIAQKAETTHVYDLDTTLPFPTPLDTYLAKSLPQLKERNKYAPWFRVVSFETFELQFSSDRRHMLVHDQTSQSPQKYLSVPPKTPLIRGKDSSHPHTLPLFLRMSNADVKSSLSPPPELNKSPSPGVLLESVENLKSFFSAPKTQQQPALQPA